LMNIWMLGRPAMLQPQSPTLMSFVTAQFEHKRPKKTSQLPSTLHFTEAKQEYDKFYPPGCCFFQIPQEVSDASPSPHYHSIQGSIVCFASYSCLLIFYLLKSHISFNAKTQFPHPPWADGEKSETTRL
jgi:hypothetical protein